MKPNLIACLYNNKLACSDERKPCQSPGRMKNSSYYIAPVGDRTHDLPHIVASLWQHNVLWTIIRTLSRIVEIHKVHCASSKLWRRSQDGYSFLDRPPHRGARMRWLAPGHTWCQVIANMHLYILAYMSISRTMTVNCFDTIKYISNF